MVDSVDDFDEFLLLYDVGDVGLMQCHEAKPRFILFVNIRECFRSHLGGDK